MTYRDYLDRQGVPRGPWVVSEDRTKCDSDGSPEGQDAQRLDGEAATARAEGIAKKPNLRAVT